MISYIIPSFNQGRYIKYTIDSVLQNMEPNDQLIIADGGSSDETAHIVTPYLNDPRLEWFSERDRGFSDAVTKALSRVRNPILGIMSSDDAYKPKIRSQVLSCFDDSEIVLAYADYELIDTENRCIGMKRHIEGSFSDLMSLRVLLPQSSVFLRTSALQGLEILSLDYDYIADVVLFNQVCQQGRFCFRREIWSEVRKHSGSRTGRRNPGIQYLKALDTVFSGLSEDVRKKAWAGGLLLRARYEASSQQRVAALRSMVSAFRLDLKIFSHWLFPRTLAYIFLGSRIVQRLEPVRQRVRT